MHQMALRNTWNLPGNRPEMRCACSFCRYHFLRVDSAGLLEVHLSTHTPKSPKAPQSAMDTWAFLSGCMIMRTSWNSCCESFLACVRENLVELNWANPFFPPPLLFGIVSSLAILKSWTFPSFSPLTFSGCYTIYPQHRITIYFKKSKVESY